VTTLADEGRPGFLGGWYQSVQSVENGLISKLVQAFRSGSGIAYTEYDENSWDGMDRDKAANFNNRVVEVYIPAMPDVKTALDRGAQVTDVGCGRGAIIVALAKAFPKATFIGYDSFGPSLEKAKLNAQVAGVDDRVRFVQQDVAKGLPEKSEIILSVYSLHHATNVLTFLQAIREGLKAGGTYVCLEAAVQDRLESNIGLAGAMTYASSVIACVPQVLSEGSEALGTAGLPPSKMQRLCAEAGFSSVRLISLDGETSNIYEAKA
jgi:2-polyprenyl-3-methyl-5-hydroxy-6-metoxy-1,4-benzoquinol methylase